MFSVLAKNIKTKSGNYRVTIFLDMRRNAAIPRLILVSAFFILTMRGTCVHTGFGFAGSDMFLRVTKRNGLKILYGIEELASNKRKDGNLFRVLKKKEVNINFFLLLIE